MIEQIKEHQQLLNHQEELTIIDFKYMNNQIAVIEVPPAPIDKLPIRLHCRVDCQSSYYKNGKIIKIPIYVLNAMRAINHNHNVEGDDKSYSNDYDDAVLKAKFISEFRKCYPSSKVLENYQIIQSFFDSRKSASYILQLSAIPQRYYPYLYINIYDRRNNISHIKITGSIYHMFNMTILALNKMLNIKVIIDKKGLLIHKSIYNFDIIKELLYNALIHRDYTPIFQGQPINIYIYNGNITITNPGYYYSDNKNYLYSKLKYSRNPTIKVTSDLLFNKEIKHHGFKYIRRISNAYNQKEPKLFNQDELFVAIIYKSNEDTIYKEPYTIEAIAEYCIEPKTKLEIYNHFFDKDKKDYGYFYIKYIEPLVKGGILAYLYPDKPKSKYQKIITAESTISTLFD